ncbi:hypothetical protein K788_00039105 [Paraburkholderia caribensis MBA4]|uniref:Uncharacterized protein n=1 Tax=Paraburkholderia caribensis MBA4 TaxID=1323664 RepID=A0A0P0R6W0_9BURK|nr:hypothetical protein K788_00039105 [Paraburkholderia caribensis MBA4]
MANLVKCESLRDRRAPVRESIAESGAHGGVWRSE